MKYLKTYESLNNLFYGYNSWYSKDRVMDSKVLFENYDPSDSFDIKSHISPEDPYGEEEWDEDKNIKPMGYTLLKDVINKKKFPYLIEFNTCGYMGVDVPRTYTKFIVNEDVYLGIVRKNCIGFNSDAPYVDNEEPEKVVHQHGIWKLIPVYQKEKEIK